MFVLPCVCVCACVRVCMSVCLCVGTENEGLPSALARILTYVNIWRKMDRGCVSKENVLTAAAAAAAAAQAASGHLREVAADELVIKMAEFLHPVDHSPLRSA